MKPLARLALLSGLLGFGAASVASPACGAAAFHPDIEYGRADEVSLLLDAYVPSTPGPHPVAILIHGGGWGRGDKRTVPEGDNSDISPWFQAFPGAGFTTFSINYRLAPAHRWPACRQSWVSPPSRIT
jgi:alpha-L-fucosidase 2